ncbi:glycogen/starch synthase, partial [Peptococcaceae bacterium]|nr:glycogen/starch synthase [Peptococcaceae bacterium]
MKILFTSSEAAPFVKTGGLGEVVGSLFKALKK